MKRYYRRRYGKYFTNRPGRPRPSAWRGFRNRVGFTVRAGGDIAHKALRTAKFVKSLVNTEFKTHNVTVSGNLTTTASINLLTGVAQGDAYNTRDGIQIKLKYLGVRYTITGNTAAEATYARIMVIIDVDANEGTPTVTDVLTDQSPTGMRNSNNTKRFVILYDKIHSMSNNAKETRYGKFTKSFNLPVKWKIDGTSINKNHIYLIAFSDQGTNYPNWTARARIKYIDN